MKNVCKRFLIWALCLALVLGILPAFAADAAGSTTAPRQSSKIVYASDEGVTFVPEGYTYVYQGANGQVYSRQAEQDIYVSARVLTAQEASSLAALSTSGEGYLVDENGQTLVCKEYDAKAAAAYSDAVKAILGDAQVSEGDQISILSEPCTAQTPVRALITFDAAPVSQLQGMSVSLGSKLGQAELQASKSIEQQQLALISRAEKKLGVDIQVNGQFSLLTNAVSVTVNYGDLAAISRISGVKSAVLMPSYSIPEINAVTVDAADLQPSLKYAAPAMGANSAWDAGYKGEGMSVAVIDTGLCFDNPSFSIEPSDPDGVAYSKEDIAAILEANDLHAEALDETTGIDTVYYSSKVPFGFNYGDSVANFGSDDDTWFGHGTHVAGIVAGNLVDEAKEEFNMETMGIAPEAQLIIMKVFDMSGNCYFDYLIAALEDAIVLGVDCANLSLGSPSGPVYLEDITEVYDAAVAAGINVVVSAGNDAHSGVGSFWGNNMVKSDTVFTGTVGMPGSFDSVLTVASAENSHIINFNDSVITWFNAKLGIRQMVIFEELPDVPEGKGFKDRLVGGIYPFTDSLKDAKGKLLFYPFDGGNADSVIAEAAKAGAAGLILTVPEATEETGWSYVEVTATRYDLPTCVSDIAQYNWMVAQNPPEGLIRVDDVWNPSATAGQMSSFSSWGPTDGLTLKPEITGIGGNVFSAYYGEYFAIASGTSMSSPAVAASAALLRQYLTENNLISGDNLNTVVNCLLMSTATPVFDEAHSTYYPARQQGAGMVNISAAIASGAYISVAGTNKAKLELGDDPGKTGIYDMTFQVVNFSDTDKTYTLDTTVLGQKAEGGQFKNGKVTYLTVDYARKLNATVTTNLIGGKLTVPAGTTANVTVTVALSDAEKAYYDERFPVGAYVEGFIQLLSDDTPNLTVPFLGFYGDFDDAPILEEGSYETILGGSHSYYTADQFHSGVWSYARISDNPDNFLTVDRYLGDTDAPGCVKIPQADYDHETMWTWATEFYSEQAGLSPNGDGNMDILGYGLALRRNADNIHYTVTNVETGEVLWEQDTGFVQKTFSSRAYAGDELSREWLYPLIVDGDWAYYDFNQCLLDNDTWVEIKADVTPEGASKPTASKSFTVYIDNEGPVPGEHFTLGTEVEQWSPEDPPITMYTFKAELAEQWFMDYSTEISLDYNEELGVWEGFAFGSTYGGSATPMRGQGGIGQTGTSVFGSNSKALMFYYDYAGNVSAYELTGGENLLNYIDLKADKTEIMAGDTITVENVAENDFNTALYWEVSDPTVAEIVESDGQRVTVKGLKKGKITVSGGFGEYKQAVEITVSDPDFEAIKTQFKDIDNHWAKEDIWEAVYRGLFKGVSDDTFAPNVALTRAQLVTVLYRMEGKPEAASQAGFQDLKENAYYVDAVNWAAENGIVKGVDDKTFAPNVPVTREQFAAILYRYAGYKGLDVTAEGDLSAFADQDQVSSYARNAVTWAVSTGLIKGVSSDTLAPKASATRAQAAVILVRFQDAYGF